MNVETIIAHLKRQDVDSDVVKAVEDLGRKYYELAQTADWIVRDSMYAAPETVGMNTLRLYISKLQKSLSVN